MDREYRILVTDAHRNIREFLKRELTEEGYNTDIAANESELFRKLDAGEAAGEEYHLVVLDMDLPVVGGIEILKRLNRRVPPVPVIVHSLNLEHKRNPVVLLADAFVEKRGNPVFLKEAVASTIGKLYPTGWDTVKAVESDGLSGGAR